jgi:hypothetical protein
VGLAGVVGSVALASLGAASFSAAAPPEDPDVAGALSLEEGVSLLSLAGASVVEELSVALLVVLVDVVAVDVVCEAAASAVVFVGGVISGVLRGTASETLAPPQALKASPQSSVAHAASAMRLLTTGPCACRT